MIKIQKKTIKSHQSGGFLKFFNSKKSPQKSPTKNFPEGKLKKYADVDFEINIIPYTSFERKGIRDKFVHWID